MDTAQIAIELKDLMSGVWVKARATAHQAITDINARIYGLGAAFVQMGGNSNNASNQVVSNFTHMGTAARKAASDIDTLNEKMSGLQTAGSVAIGTLAARGVESAYEFAKDQLKQVATAGMQGSVTKAQYETMNGVASGDKLYSDLTKYIQDSIWDNDLYQHATLLNGFGFKADQILPEEKILGDLSMGRKDWFSGLNLVTGQVKGADKLQGQDLMQYINNGFNPLAEISAMTGKSMGSLKDAMSEGKISFDMVQAAMEHATSAGGKYYHMLDNITNSPYGKMTAMEGNVDNARLGLGTDLLPALGGLMDAAKPILDELPNALKEMTPAIQDAIHGLADLLKWTHQNREGLMQFAGVVKVGVEAWVAWKVGTMAVTAANWLLASSTTANAVQATAATEAITLENVALEEQAAAVNVARSSWAMMNAETKAAILNQSALSANLPINMSGVAGMGGRSAMAGGAGFVSGLSSAIVPISIAYFAGEALAQMIAADPWGHKGWDLGRMLGASFNGGANTYETMALGGSVLKTIGFDPIGDAIDNAQTNKYIRNNQWRFTKNDQWGIPQFGGDALTKNIGAASGFKWSDPAKATDSQKESTEAITGGGKQPITINYYKGAIEQHYNVRSMAEAQGMSLEEFAQSLVETLRSVAGR